MQLKNKRDIGSRGEKIACEFLKKQGYAVLRLNYRVGRLGEIDIIARENECICFVEVKTRSSTLFGLPSESVNWLKQENIRKLAQVYLVQNNLVNAYIRFDVIEIFINNSIGNTEKISINHIKNAF